MITPSHLIYSWAVAKYTEKTPHTEATKHRTAAFVLGALLPDVPVFVFFLVCGLILGYSNELLWDDMYFNSGWSVLFTLSHSLIIWPILTLFATYKHWLFVRSVAISACFHIIIDFFVHTADAYMHFWPLSNWRFTSPISYWDPAAYGQYVGVFDSILIIGLLSWLFSRYETHRFQIFIGILLMVGTIRLLLEFNLLIRYV
jgi:hypothetical protein